MDSIDLSFDSNPLQLVCRTEKLSVLLSLFTVLLLIQTEKYPKNYLK